MANSGKTEKRRVDISHIEIYSFCHATEDCARVEEAIRNLFPPDTRRNVKIDFSSEEGYYKNPINILSVKILDEDLVESILNHISTILEPIEKTILKATFDLRYDQRSGRFIVRFSKQDLFLGKPRVSDTDDVVKLVIHVKGDKRRQNVLDFLRVKGIIT